jgi:hypothetical protein
MRLETQTPLPTPETARTVTEVGQETYTHLDGVIKRLLLVNELTGARDDKLRFCDENLGIDVLIHGDTPTKGDSTAPEVLVDNLHTDVDFKRLVIQANGTMKKDGETIFDISEAEEKAAFAEFVVTLPRVSNE